jgi:hypothetical protein
MKQGTMDHKRPTKSSGFVISRCSFSAAGRAITFLLSSAALCSNALALGQVQHVEAEDRRGNFTIVRQREACTIYVDVHDYPGVVRAAF